MTNIPMVICCFRFGIITLYTVIFGRFPRPKSAICWPKNWIFRPFLKSDNLKKHSILICHFGHFLFSTLLNVARYTLSTISWSTVLTPINVRFFWFLVLNFLKLLLEITVIIAIVGNVPGNDFVSLLFPEPCSFGRFPRQK